MKHTEILQQIINRVGAVNYLEIGIAGGFCLLQLKAPRKFGVDPGYSLSRRLRLRYFMRNFSTSLHRVPSDDFFAKVEVPGGLDVAFVDGLHTWQQALRDVENCLKILNPGGVILMHDCNPEYAAAGVPAESYDHAKSMDLPDWNNEWCGDVWKAVVHLRSRHPELNVFTLNCDFGLGVVTRGTPGTALDLAPEQIEKLNYEDLAKDRSRLLDLRSPSHLPEFLNSLAPVRR